MFQTREVLTSVLPKYCHGTVVDLGCGYGKYKGLIEQFSDKYISVDNKSSADQFNNNQTPNLDYVCDVSSTPLLDNYADTVICTEVIEHVPDPFKVMKEISRILKPGGYLILSSGWLTPYHPEPKDYWRFSHEGYEELCNRQNLKIVESHKQGGFWIVIFFLFFRRLDLKHKKLYLKLIRPINFIYKVVDYLDNSKKTMDSIGHLIIAKKV